MSDASATRLPSCPSTPNCVCSEDGRGAQSMPYPPDGRVGAMKLLDKLLAGMPRTEVTRRDGDFVEAVTQTLIFRFKDDLAFRFDDAAGVVQVRSASRLGKHDLGTNGRRMRKLRDAWTRWIG